MRRGACRSERAEQLKFRLDATQLPGIPEAVINGDFAGLNSLTTRGAPAEGRCHKGGMRVTGQMRATLPLARPNG